MEKYILGIIAFPILFSLLAFRVPIGLAMLVVGYAGTILITGWLPVMSLTKTSAWHLFSNYSLSFPFTGGCPDGGGGMGG